MKICMKKGDCKELSSETVAEQKRLLKELLVGGEGS
jgi:hypothetical protein